MEKLELEQLAPYLPYGVKIGRFIAFYSKGNKINMFRKITLIVTNLKSILKNPKEYKLILRPLSDYFKTGLNVFSNEDMTYMKLIIEGQTFHYGSISYSTIIWLCKEHYDFQNLIPKGLAIDINTIKS